MNYKTILAGFVPVEYGDFFHLYRINGRGFVIYCEHDNVVSCLELCGFSIISPVMLAEIIGIDTNTLKDTDEFSFPVKCSKQQIISYLFDVSAKETNVKMKHVSGLQGYLLKSIVQDKANKNSYRNIFQFDTVKGTANLLFDDRQCLTSIRTDKCGAFCICWSPILFFGLDKSGDPDSTGLLLASSSPLLVEYVLSKIPSDRKVHVITGYDYYEALVFVSMFIMSRDLPYKLVICSDSMNVTVRFVDWPTPQKVLNFISAVNKHIPDGYEKLSCLMVNKKTFLQIPNLKSYLKPMLSVYTDLLQSDSIYVSL